MFQNMMMKTINMNKNFKAYLESSSQKVKKFKEILNFFKI